MYFVTISEMYGTMGEKIAKEVANKLNYSFYGDQELLKAAEETGFLADVKKMDEKGPTFFERFFSEKPKVYLDRLQSVIFEVAQKGNAVFFGRGSQLLLNSFDCALHILVTGTMEKRIERVMEEKKVGREVAEKILSKSDHDKRGFIRFAFDQDWLNPDLYDVLLNTDKLSVGSAAEMIIHAARSDEIKSCGIDSVKSLGQLSLHRKIEAGLLEAGWTNQHIFFNVEDTDTVRVYGIANSSEEKEAVAKVLKGIMGIKKVINGLTIVRSASMGA